MAASAPRELTLAQEQRLVRPTGVERFLGKEEFIVSKTNTKGHITYANEVFCRIAGYSLDQVMGQPHSIVRHPDMPRCVFKLLWDTISSGQEIFAYVKNLAKNGDHYWVFAHVTPTYDAGGQIIGYHSNRRAPDRSAVTACEHLYRDLKTIEESHTDRREGLEASFAAVIQLLESKGITYEQFVFSITP